MSKDFTITDEDIAAIDQMAEEIYRYKSPYPSDWAKSLPTSNTKPCPAVSYGQPISTIEKKYDANDMWNSHRKNDSAKVEKSKTVRLNVKCTCGSIVAYGKQEQWFYHSDWCDIRQDELISTKEEEELKLELAAYGSLYGKY